jgi:CHAT domain-containing protein
MARLKVNSPGWDVRRNLASRGAGEIAGVALPGLPDDFLAAGARIDEEVILQPRAVARDAAGSPGPIDLTTELGPAETAILAIRRPSGALSFHPPTETVRRLRGGPSEVQFIVPPRAAASTSAPSSRGLAGTALKAIVVKFTGSALDKIAGLTLPKLAELFESATWKRRGLKEGWLKLSRAALTGKALPSLKPTSTERTLLFIHGTFSNAAAAFDDLASSSFFDDVAARYGDRIFAFDHFTLCRTPEDNARMLLETLPDKTFTFDVITHSRGGLVLRNLVERAAAFGSLSRRLQIGRIVLVASPNEGTPLATPRRWEDTVGWIANLLELFPDNPFTTGPAFVANGLVWLSRHLSVDVPGLAAMDGDGAMIRELQAPPGPPADRYSALVANCNPAGNVLERLLDAGLDQFFGSANDLVVPSEGGWRVDRTGSAFITGDRIGCFGPGGNLPGDSVTHVNIFAQPGAPSFLAKALAGDVQPLRAVDPAKSLPDRRLLRAGAEGVAAPAITVSGIPAVPRRTRVAVAHVASAASAAAPASLAITVVNGDLSFERRPLLIGHYRSTQLTGAEAFIDRLLQRTMTRSLDMDVYPAEPGSHQIFPNTAIDVNRDWLTPRPAAVIVVGLGQEGDLRPRELSMSVRRAVVAWAQRIAEDARSRRGRGKTPRTIELASTLMGSGGLGVTAAHAAVLIAQGVFDANLLLSRPDSGLPSVSGLRLIELYTDRAREAWQALRMQSEATPGRFDVSEPIETGTGWLLRPIESGYRGANYDYIEATLHTGETGESAIEYSLDTSRARTEVRAQSTQARLVQNLVKEASSATTGDSDIGRTLYKLLVPIELEGFLASADQTQLVLDAHTAGIPWEMLDDEAPGRHDDPWAIRSKLLRKFKTERFRERVSDATSRATVLVVGEPDCPPEYPPLPGALAEARAVAELLTAAKGEIVDSVRAVMVGEQDPTRPNARTVLGALLNGEWTIVHVAGHGALVDDAGNPGGVVLSDGTFLGPSEVGAMRIVPRLVFLNCCHLGAFQSDAVLSDRANFASGVARRLIEIGVRCVVVAGWAVDDQAARAFAEAFYRALLSRQKFVDAVQQARKAAFAFTGYTWAAYQCYGDPDWRLAPVSDQGAPAPASPDEFKQIATVPGLKLALRTLTIQSTYQREIRPAQAQHARLDRLEQRWRDMRWTVENGVGELFAEAYEAVGDLDAAIGWYDTVLEGGTTDVSLKALAGRSNLRIRRASERVEREVLRLADAAPRRTTATASRAKNRRSSSSAALRKMTDAARRVIATETKRLRSLPVLGASLDREIFVGAAMKQLALVENAAGRRTAEREAIRQMRLHYLRALEGRRTSSFRDIHYPAVNVIVAQLALGESVERALFDEVRQSLRAMESDGPTFWSVVGQTELTLFRAINRKHLAIEKRRILAGYDDVAKRMRGSAHWHMVFDTASFVLSRYRRQARRTESKACDEILDYLRKQVPVTQ